MAGLGTFLIEFGVDYDSLRRDLNKAESRVETFGKNLERSATAISLAISAPLALLAKRSIEAFGELEALKMSLKTIEGTAQNTERRLRELNEVAKLPGIGFKEAIQADVRLRSVGISADTAKRAMLAFGNAIATAGGGKAQFDSVIHQLQELSTRTKVLAEDFKPIVTAVPQVAMAAKKLFGSVDTKVISAQLQKAKIGTKEFIDMIISELEKLPKVTGGVKNSIENLQDTFFKAFAKIGETIDKNVGIQKWVEKVEKLVEGAADAFSELSPEAQKAIIVISGIAVVIPPLLAVGAALGAIISPAGAVVAALGGSAAIIVENWEKISSTISGVVDDLERMYITARFYTAQFRQAMSLGGNTKELAEVYDLSDRYRNKERRKSVVDTEARGRGYDINEPVKKPITTFTNLGGGYRDRVKKTGKYTRTDI